MSSITAAYGVIPIAVDGAFSLRRVSSSADSDASLRRCCNCNYSFYIVDVGSNSLLRYRCPRCHGSDLIPGRTTPTPRPPPSTRLTWNSVSSDYKDDRDSARSKSFVDSPPIEKSPPNSTPSSKTCSICLDDFEENHRKISELPCKHFFHEDCIDEWIQRSKTCPLCRKRLPSSYGISRRSNESRARNDSSSTEAIDTTRVRELAASLIIVGGIPNLYAYGSVTASRGWSRARDEVTFTASGGGGIRITSSGRREVDAMQDEDGDTFMTDT